MKAIQKNSYGIKMTDPTRTITIKRNGELFVDDTGLTTNMDAANSSQNTENVPTSCIKSLSHDGNKHQKYLHISGGNLALSK